MAPSPKSLAGMPARTQVKIRTPSAGVFRHVLILLALLLCFRDCRFHRTDLEMHDFGGWLWLCIKAGVNRIGGSTVDGFYHICIIYIWSSSINIIYIYRITKIIILWNIFDHVCTCMYHNYTSMYKHFIQRWYGSFCVWSLWILILICTLLLGKPPHPHPQDFASHLGLSSSPICDHLAPWASQLAQPQA